jgi:hypothetical protein
MADKMYVGDIGTALVADIGADIDGATDTKLLVLKPDGTEEEWPADIFEIDGQKNYLRYLTEAGDFDQAGKYKIQAYLSKDGWSGKGETDRFKVYAKFR